MQEEPEPEENLEEHELATPNTLYSLAMRAMKEYIEVYLALTRQTHALATVQAEHIQNVPQKIVLLSGIDSSLDPVSTTPEQVVQEWERTRAVPFDVELAITKGVYIQLRSRVQELVEELEDATQGFQKFDPLYISAHPYMLPIFQRLADIPSKEQLRKRIGTASDNAVPITSAERLAHLLNQRVFIKTVNYDQLLQSIEPTLEGIVRDLVGRVLLESIVANALDDAHVPYQRESEYNYLEGVIYNFRADFVIPDSQLPQAFIEVRKSSTRHASLYAKDKMFSAINWKGKQQKMLAVLVVDGPWTAETLKVLAKVFDYVVPLNSVSQVAQDISAYIQGDKSKLRWLIDFAIRPAASKTTANDPRNQ